MKDIKIDNLISQKRIADLLDVTPRTVNRWEKRYNWTVIRLNQKFKRFVKSEVAESLGLEIPSSI